MKTDNPVMQAINAAGGLKRFAAAAGCNHTTIKNICSGRYGASTRVAEGMVRASGGTITTDDIRALSGRPPSKFGPQSGIDSHWEVENDSQRRAWIQRRAAEGAKATRLALEAANASN